MLHDWRNYGLFCLLSVHVRIVIMWQSSVCRKYWWNVHCNRSPLWLTDVSAAIISCSSPGDYALKLSRSQELGIKSWFWAPRSYNLPVMVRRPRPSSSWYCATSKICLVKWYKPSSKLLIGIMYSMDRSRTVTVYLSAIWSNYSTLRCNCLPSGMKN
jgi:hypothetical protein